MAVGVASRFSAHGPQGRVGMRIPAGCVPRSWRLSGPQPAGILRACAVWSVLVCFLFFLDGSKHPAPLWCSDRLLAWPSNGGRSQPGGEERGGTKHAGQHIQMAGASRAVGWS